MKKYKNKNIFLSLLFLFLLVVITSIFTYRYMDYETTEDIKEEYIAQKEDKVNISKIETEDYYYYTVKDNERNLSYSWKFIKDKDKDISVEDSLHISEDLRLSIDADTIDTEKINEMVNQKKLIISFDYHGELPLETKVSIYVGDKFQDGEKLYLYYYNPEVEEIEYIMHNVEVQSGVITFQISHCSDYFLTAAVVNEAVNNPKSVNYIIIGLIAIVFVLVAVTLLQSKK